MKKECEIVQDLLFGYSDETLSDSSKELVEKHLKDCEECKKILDEIKNDSKKKTEKKEVDYLKKIKKKMKRKSILITITTILLVFFIIFNILVYINYRQYAEEMEIFLLDDITQEQLSDIEKTIKDIYDKSKITYHSKEEALEDMKKKFGENANLLSGYSNENNIFPASYIVKTKTDKVEEIASKLITMPGVKQITTNINTNPYALLYFSLKNDI